MRAMIVEGWGEPETLRLAERPRPEPGPGEVLIAVAAAGLNFADILMIGGTYQEKPTFPFSPGLELAGRVAAVGSGVAGVKPGQRVMALVDHGAFADFALARQSDVFALPDTMDDLTAAGFPIAYGTAHGALKWRAALAPGELLLVNGAAGGVGLTAVEVGKAMGAYVVASARGAEKLAVAKDHGADALIDYGAEPVRDRLKAIAAGLGKPGVDVLFDPVGGEAFETAFRAMGWGGRILVIGFAGGAVAPIPANILLVKNLAALGFYWGSYRTHRPDLLSAEFAELFAWHAAGRLKPHVSHRLPLAQAAEGLRLIKERRSTGKVVLDLTVP
jgi:NADPH:quinone reductase